MPLILLKGPSGCCVENGLKGHKPISRKATGQTPAGERPGGMEQGGDSECGAGWMEPGGVGERIKGVAADTGRSGWAAELSLNGFKGSINSDLDAMTSWYLGDVHCGGTGVQERDLSERDGSGDLVVHRSGWCHSRGLCGVGRAQGEGRAGIHTLKKSETKGQEHPGRGLPESRRSLLKRGEGSGGCAGSEQALCRG